MYCNEEDRAVTSTAMAQLADQWHPRLARLWPGAALKRVDRQGREEEARQLAARAAAIHQEASE
jgi:hypothetical protein